MIRRLSTAALVALACATSACNAQTLAAIGAAALKDGAAASPAPGVSSAPTTTAPASSAATAATPTASADPEQETFANATALANFQASLPAINEDPRAVAAFFISGLVTYEKDPVLGRAMMSLLAANSEIQDSAKSPTGKDFIQARNILFLTLDRKPSLGRIYLDSPEAADGDDIPSHVVFDDEYKTQETIGVNEARGEALFFIGVNHEGTRSRPIRLRKENGAWRVHEFSSMMVQV